MAELEKEINETPAEETVETAETVVESNPWEENIMPSGIPTCAWLRSMTTSASAP